MKYGNSELQGKFLLAPMAGYTDIAFRLLCRRQGAAMCFTEFANAEAIVRSGAARPLANREAIVRCGNNTDALLQTCNAEMPVGIQIFGSSPQSMGKAAGMISKRVEEGELFASCIDINFGCPAISVIRAGAGSALLRSPEKMRAVAEACVDASSIPVTAKIRAGWKKDDGETLAKMLEGAGVAGITAHWRTATEGRKRGEGWGALAKVKEAVGIPLIGNGGATTPELAVRFLKESGCDAVMIASGALGNPFIFTEANQMLASGKYGNHGWEKRKGAFGEYVALAQDCGIASTKRLRQQAIMWVAGFPGVKEARKRLNAAKTNGEIAQIVGEFSPHSRSSEMKI